MDVEVLILVQSIWSTPYSSSHCSIYRSKRRLQINFGIFFAKLFRALWSVGVALSSLDVTLVVQKNLLHEFLKSTTPAGFEPAPSKRNRYFIRICRRNHLAIVPRISLVRVICMSGGRAVNLIKQVPSLRQKIPFKSYFRL